MKPIQIERKTEIMDRFSFVLGAIVANGSVDPKKACELAIAAFSSADLEDLLIAIYEIKREARE